jgi:hypothetical protein
MHRASFFLLSSLLVVATAGLPGCGDDILGGEGGGGGGDATTSTGTSSTTSTATGGTGSTGSGGDVCPDFCGENGFAVGESDGGEGCLCSEPVDDECWEGMAAVCGCAEACDDANRFALYSECHRNVEPTREFVLCVGSFTAEDGLSVDCTASEDACDWPE